MKNLSLAVAIIFTFISNVAFGDSERVMPIYNGFWYKYSDGVKFGLCSAPEHSYEGKYPDKYSLIATLAEELPDYDECTWEIHVTYNDRALYNFPKDFPGSIEEYRNIIATDKQYTNGYFEAFCYQGEILIDQEFDPFYPSFKCPPGTYENYDSPGCYKVSNTLCTDENGNPRAELPDQKCRGCGCGDAANWRRARL